MSKRTTETAEETIRRKICAMAVQFNEAIREAESSGLHVGLTLRSGGLVDTVSVRTVERPRRWNAIGELS